MTEQTEHDDRTPEPGRAALPLNEAAQLAGLVPDALRMRYRRGTIPGYRDEAGRIFIYADAIKASTTAGPNAHAAPTERAEGRRPNATERAAPTDRTSPEASGLVDELRRQLARLEAREAELLADLRAEREASARERYRADTLLQGAQAAAQTAQEQARALLLAAPMPGNLQTQAANLAGAVPIAQPLEAAGPTMSTAQAAAALGRSPRTLREWAGRADAPIRPLPIPGPHRWSTAEVRRLVRAADPME